MSIKSTISYEVSVATLNEICVLVELFHPATAVMMRKQMKSLDGKETTTVGMEQYITDEFISELFRLVATLSPAIKGIMEVIMATKQFDLSALKAAAANCTVRDLSDVFTEKKVA